MRFVLALVALVVAAVLVGLGVAQRTVLLPENHATITAGVSEDAHYLVIPGSVLDSHTGAQHIHIEGPGAVFAAYGRTSDVTAWLSGERYQAFSVDKSGAMQPGRMTTAPVVAGLTASGTPDPDGSDLWLDQARGTKTLDWIVDVPSSVALLVASNGKDAAPPTVTVSWPVHVSTPFSTPLIVGGSVLAVIGLLLYVWALVHMRRRRGPRRKPPAKMPKPPPPPKVKQPKVQAPAATRGRRSVRRMVAALPAVGVLALLTACTGSPAPLPVVTQSTKPVTVTPAALTQAQAKDILTRVAATTATADKKLDATTLATRFAGSALALRTAAYTVKKKDTKATLPQAIPTTTMSVGVTLPQATTGWPRTLFAEVTDSADAKAPPVALTLVQQDPRSQYLVQYEVSLEPNVKQLPTLPSSLTGAARLAADTPLLRVTPAELARDYGLMLQKSDVKEAALFDTTNDALLQAVGVAAKKKASKALGSTAKLTFSEAGADPSTIVAVATADSGALVSVGLTETWTVKPVKSGVTIKPSGATKILAKSSSSSKGFASVYSYQLLFSVPSAASTDKAVLLGYSQGIVQAKHL